MKTVHALMNNMQTREIHTTNPKKLFSMNPDIREIFLDTGENLIKEDYT